MMKVGDKVQFVLCETQFTGSVLKIHRKEGWKGYARILLDNSDKIEMPMTYLEVLS